MTTEEERNENECNKSKSCKAGMHYIECPHANWSLY